MSISEKRTEFTAGLRAAAPLLVAMVPIGVVFGAVAISKGLSPLEASLMSLLVFAAARNSSRWISGPIRQAGAHSVLPRCWSICAMC